MKLLNLQDAGNTVRRIVALLKDGEVVGIPTDTCYGLAACAKNERAVKQVFKIKERAPENPISIFLKSLPDAQSVARIDRSVSAMLKALLAISGRFTFILPAKKGTGLLSPYIIHEGRIGIRIPRYDLPKAIVRALHMPITATSANKSGDPPIYKYEKLKGLGVKYAVKTVLPETPPSTVIDLTRQPPKVLREGAVSKETLRVLNQW